MIDFLKMFAAGLLALVIASLIIIQPRLVGYNCEGSSLPQLAQYESDFTACERIETIF